MKTSVFDFPRPMWSLMRMLCLAQTILCLGAFLARGAEPQPANFSYADLVRRLTDLEYLATLPAPGEKAEQWSSYDRASRYDAGAGKYLEWDANGDGDKFIRKENGKIVMAEMQGPGCIWRIWSATPKEGHVRIYLDGAAEPAVDLPFTGYFDGKNPPFTRPALVHTTAANGWNNYTPIPYQKSCRIVADENWGAYFQFVYSTFPPGTQVPTFQRELGPEANAALDEANRHWSHCGPRDFPQANRMTMNGRLPGGSAGTTRLDGPGAIRGIRARFDPPLARGDVDRLREIVLLIKWDGEASPSVWTPLGDFFGTAPGANPYRSFPCGLTEDGWFYANWFMPFSKSAEVTLRNEGGQEANLDFEFFTEKLPVGANDYARFHAKWHRDEFLPTSIDRQIDWPLLKTTGRGRYVGVMLHIWNARGGWWGEGDEKLFIDGEKFPSTFGTGSEDYFGYAWSSATLFQHALHNQTRNDDHNRGHISVNRWHLADQIPFQKQFDGYIEKYYLNRRGTLYASTVFWYLEPGGRDPYSAVPLQQRAGYYTVPPSKKVPDAAEAESLDAVHSSGGSARRQDMAGFGDDWSQDAQLWWTDGRPGDTLELVLPVARAGQYHVLAQFTKALDYGVFQLALDGKPLGGSLDLYHPWVIATGELDLGTCQLDAGDHKLTVEITGANPKAEKRYMFGLDYLKLVETGRTQAH